MRSTTVRRVILPVLTFGCFVFSVTRWASGQATASPAAMPAAATKPIAWADTGALSRDQSERVRQELAKPYTERLKEIDGILKHWHKGDPTRRQCAQEIKNIHAAQAQLAAVPAEQIRDTIADYLNRLTALQAQYNAHYGSEATASEYAVQLLLKHGLIQKATYADREDGQGRWYHVEYTTRDSTVHRGDLVVVTVTVPDDAHDDSVVRLIPDRPRLYVPGLARVGNVTIGFDPVASPFYETRCSLPDAPNTGLDIRFDPKRGVYVTDW